MGKILLNAVSSGLLWIKKLNNDFKILFTQKVATTPLPLIFPFVESVYLNITLNFEIPAALVFQLEVY